MSVLGSKFADKAAINLLLGTAAVESEFGTYIRQIGGPARGVFQMEPATERSLWDTYLFYHNELRHQVLLITGVGKPNELALLLNLAYQIVMARLLYWRVPAALPEADDVHGLGRYWKRHYNTVLGAGTSDRFVAKYQQYVAGPM